MTVPVKTVLGFVARLPFYIAVPYFALTLTGIEQGKKMSLRSLDQKFIRYLLLFGFVTEIERERKNQRESERENYFVLFYFLSIFQISLIFYYKTRMTKIICIIIIITIIILLCFKISSDHTHTHIYVYRNMLQEFTREIR